MYIFKPKRNKSRRTGPVPIAFLNALICSTICTWMHECCGNGRLLPFIWHAIFTHYRYVSRIISQPLADLLINWYDIRINKYPIGIHRNFHLNKVCDRLLSHRFQRGFPYRFSKSSIQVKALSRVGILFFQSPKEYVKWKKISGKSFNLRPSQP